MSVSPRELEALTAELFTRLGFDVELTPPSRDLGRDVLARRTETGRQTLTLVECKHHAAPIGVEYVRALLGAVEQERANGGVLVASGRFTRGAQGLAEANPRLELIDGDALMRLLNEHVSRSWSRQISRLTREH